MLRPLRRRRIRKNLYPRSSEARRKSSCPLDKDLSWKSDYRQRSAFTLYRLRLAVRDFVLNRWPLLVNPLKDECGIIYCPVHEISLRHVRFVRVHVDELPRSQDRRGKWNCKLSFLGHTELLHCGVKFRRENREPQSTFYCPTSP